MSEKTKLATVAKQEDGTIQITLTIPLEVVKKNREEALQKMAESTAVPGFRKGKAPIDKVKEQINDNALLEKTLAGILPKLFGDVVDENNLKPIIYPKFELIKATEDEDWQVRAITCEAPEIKLGDYKTKIAGIKRSNAIWTPDKAKGSEDKKPEATQAEKEQEVLKGLLKEVDVVIPKILLDEDVNARLSNLLARLEKLGLSLDSYLASVGKTAETLRSEYEQQSRESLSLDFILNKIAEEEKIEVKSEEIDAAIQAAGQTPQADSNLNSPEQRRFIDAILKRRKALDSILSL